MFENKCVLCGNYFDTEHEDIKYCEECLLERNAPIPKEKCQCCGKEFESYKLCEYMDCKDCCKCQEHYEEEHRLEHFADKMDIIHCKEYYIRNIYGNLSNCSKCNKVLNWKTKATRIAIVRETECCGITHTVVADKATYYRYDCIEDKNKVICYNCSTVVNDNSWQCPNCKEPICPICGGQVIEHMDWSSYWDPPSGSSECIKCGWSE